MLLAVYLISIMQSSVDTCLHGNAIVAMASQMCGGCRLFRQPLVPLVSAADGKWLVPQGLAPILKPGGHGAIWKLMLDEGIFSWMYQHDREAAIVRQIRYCLCMSQLVFSGMKDGVKGASFHLYGSVNTALYYIVCCHVIHG